MRRRFPLIVHVMNLFPFYCYNMLNSKRMPSANENCMTKDSEYSKYIAIKGACWFFFYCLMVDLESTHVFNKKTNHNRFFFALQAEQKKYKASINKIIILI